MGDFYFLGFTAHFALFSEDEAAGICDVSSISCHSSRGRSQAFGFQIAVEQICCGRAGPDLTVQHLQCWLKVRMPWDYRRILSSQMGIGDILLLVITLRETSSIRYHECVNVLLGLLLDMENLPKL